MRGGSTILWEGRKKTNAPPAGIEGKEKGTGEKGKPTSAYWVKKKRKKKKMRGRV